MTKLRVLDLFSGIGGFSLGLERTGGFETVAFCEIEPFPRRVLAKHWPGVPCYDDVRTLTADRLAADGIVGIDVITGGFPCQDISLAGRQAGITSETRSGLWSEITRLTRELRPQFVIVENVSNLLAGPTEQPGGWFSRVLGDLAEIGYDAEWHCIPASAIGAHHRRDRIWVLVHPNEGGRDIPCLQEQEATQQHEAFRASAARNANSARLAQREGKRSNDGPKLSAIIGADWWITEPALGRVADGVPDRVDRLKSLGNAVVPQIPELIGRAILAARAAA
jgi:DNA (cytosine-5)-methyltransferase 1